MNNTNTDRIIDQLTRVTALVGHYGSGKTELSVNLAMDAKTRLDRLRLDEQFPEDILPYCNVTICDLDIANPYFRSREKKSLFVKNDIDIISNTFEADITEDLPAVSPRIVAPLQQNKCRTILDVGGNKTGAMLLNQYKKYLTQKDSQLLGVVNANRPETDNFLGVVEHINSIILETGIPFAGLINNTHMLNETTVEDVIKGHLLCREISEAIGVPLLFDSCRQNLVKALAEEGERRKLKLNIYPMKLYMRPTWLQR
jgi:hypothetical protein